MASSRPLGNWSDQTTMAEVLRWTMSLLPGSSGVVDNGCAWTSGVSGPHRPEYFSGARTLIVGLDNGLVPPGHATTKVHWDVPLALTAAPALGADYDSTEKSPLYELHLRIPAAAMTIAPLK